MLEISFVNLISLPCMGSCFLCVIHIDIRCDRLTQQVQMALMAMEFSKSNSEIQIFKIGAALS